MPYLEIKKYNLYNFLLNLSREVLAGPGRLWPALEVLGNFGNAVRHNIQNTGFADALTVSQEYTQSKSRVTQSKSRVHSKKVKSALTESQSCHNAAQKHTDNIQSSQRTSSTQEDVYKYIVRPAKYINCPESRM